METTLSSVSTVPGRLPGVGHLIPFLRRPLPFMESLRSHGDIARIYLGRQPVYVVNSPESIHRMFVEEQRNLHNGRIFDKARQIIGNGIPFSDGAFYVRQRRIIQPAFHRDRIARYAEVMNDLAVSKAESWQAGQVLDVHAEMRRLVIETVAKTLFSTDLGRVAVTEIQRSIPVTMKAIVSRTVSPSQLAEKLPWRGNRELETASDRLKRVIGDVISAYRADGQDRGDLLSMLLLARDEETGEGMTDSQLYDEILGILVSGTETATLTLSWLFHELGRYPEVEQRLHAELDELVGRASVGFADLAKLEYTRQVFNEVIRVHHPLWLLMRRAIATVQLGGVSIPPGTELLYSPYALHRDPVLYPDPKRFDPDRWLPERAAQIPEGAYVPFGLGRRLCIGESFGWAEVAIATAAIATRWRLLPVPGKPVREVAWATVQPENLVMTAQPRTQE
jgi:cytochrome P450